MLGLTGCLQTGPARSVPHQTTIRLARCPLMVAALLLVGRRSRGGLTSERATKAVAQWSSLVQGRPPGRQRRALGPASVAVVVLLAIVVGGVASAASYAATASAYGMGSGGDGTSSESNGRMVLSRLSGDTAIAGPTLRSRRSESRISLTPSATEPHWACPNRACEAIIDPRPARVSRGYALPDGGPQLEGSGELGGYSPQDLQSAYKIPTALGSPQTIALVDAFGYTAAESDLAKYRERYGLEPCTKGNGCFTKVNEKGEEANYPPNNEEWELESALDLDMASAACPKCHILLVEATTENPADMAESVNTAAKLGATEISNSYGYPEGYEPYCGKTGCVEYSEDYKHPGVVVTEIHKRGGMNEADYERFLEHSKSTHPLGRVGDPSEIAELVFYLASNRAAWITGATLLVDGGLLAGSYRMARDLQGPAEDTITS